MIGDCAILGRQGISGSPGMLGAFDIGLGETGRRQGRFNPLTLSPALWLDFSDANTLYDATSGGSFVAPGGDIYRIEDKSGNLRHATLTGTGTIPTRQTSVVNNRDVCRFPGGSDRRLKTANFGLAQPYTTFVVWKINGGAAGQNVVDGIGTGRMAIYWRSAAGNRHGAFLGTAVMDGRVLSAPSPFFVTSLVGSGAASQIYYNGSLDASGSSGTSSPTGVTIGGEAGALADLNGDVAEVLVYPTILSTPNRQAVESYLTAKYAL